MTLFDSEYAPRERPRRSRRQRVGIVALGIAALCAVVFAVTPSPYVIEQPGQVYNTLGTVTINDAEEPLITVSGATTFDTEGSLDMLTVSIVGNRDHPLSWFEAGLAWFDSNRTLLPMDAVFPPGQTSEQQQQQNQAEMVNSQQDAIAAALINMGYPVGRDVTVSMLANTSPATGVLQVDDIILEANGQTVDSVDQLRAAVNALGGAAVPLTIDRAGVTESVSVTPIQADSGNWVLGIGARVVYEFPVTVTIQLDRVGGPSAGMMFALGIITKMTPNGDLNGGKRWAGTGTIDADGNVGAIGGIAHKMVGARAAGADYMLAPQSNCDEVVGHIPNGLEVFAVSTLEQAVQAVEAVASGADTSQLERCTAG